MKRFYTLMLAFACCVSFRALGQTLTLKDNVNINANCNGYLEVLPPGYNPAAATTYPTIFFFMGIGATGPGTTTSLQALITGSPGNPGNGFIQDQVAAGIWPATFSGGNSFIVIIPQFVSAYSLISPPPVQVNDIINYTIQHYKVDTTRMYLTGNSSGGGPVWNYPAASSSYANRIAAIVPFCGVSIPSKEKADVIRNAHIAVWAFHNDLDGGVPSAFTKDYVSLINSPTPAVPQVKQSILTPAPPAPPTSHDCWFNAYMRLYTESGLNIYDWMLQFQRTVTKANAGDDQNITLPVSTAQLSGSGTGPGGTITSINWQLLSGPGSGGTISNPASLNPTISGLVYGTYVYRLSITDPGGTATDDVVINVYPQRIEAENFTASANIGATPAIDEGGGSSMNNWWPPNAFAEYSVNVPAAGTYIMRFRVAAFFQHPSLVVKSGSTTLANLNIYWTEGWDNYITMTRTVTLPAGPQTIRIEGTNEDFNLNWMQLLSTGAPGPLPVKFSLLNASCDNGRVKLNWKTSMEENLERFAVERSRDGRTWDLVSEVKSVRNSNIEQEYSFTVNEINAGNQYRIAGIDPDGKRTYSSIIKANCNGRNEFSIFPNPVFDNVQVNLDLQSATKVKLIVIDTRGTVVMQQEKNALQGRNQFTVNLSSLPAGNYTLTAQTEDETRSVKLIRQ